jgi:hypothetical protein
LILAFFNDVELVTAILVSEIGEKIFDLLYLFLSLAVGFFEFFDSASDFFLVEGADLKSLFEDANFFLSFLDSGLDHLDSVDHGCAAIFFFLYWSDFISNDLLGNNFISNDFIGYDLNLIIRNNLVFGDDDDTIISYDDFCIGNDGFDFFNVDLNLFFEFFDFLLDFNWIDLGVFLDEFLEFSNTFFDSSDFDDLLFDDYFGVFFNNFLFFNGDDLLFFDNFLFKLFDLSDHLGVNSFFMFLDESLEDSNTFLLFENLLFFGLDLLFDHDSIDFHFINRFL